MVLALAMVFSLVFSSVAMAAPEGEEISNKLVLEVTVEEEVELEDPSFTLIGIAENSAVGLYDNFVMEIEPGDYENVNALGKIKLTNGNVNGFDLEFKLPDGTWFGPVKFGNAPGNESNVYYFGPKPQGDKLGNVKDTEWRVTWKESGTYEFEVSIVEVDEQGQLGNQLGETEVVSVNVTEGKAMALKHATAEAGEVASIKNPETLMSAIADLNPTDEPAQYTVTKEGKFDYVVVADLANDVSHVDNVLFVFEVAKEGDDNITEDDFEITAISLRDDTEGINDTFEVGDGGVLRGYWGPAEGFLFAGEAATAFTVKFNAEGTYTVNTYAIQVAPTAQADL
jgi:hypothetical protein